MADSSRFRTALNGFNRADVADYIESICTQHQNALKQLQNENRQLRSENEALQSKVKQAEADYQKLLEDDAALQEQIEQLAQEGAELAGQLAEQKELAEQLAGQLTEQKALTEAACASIPEEPAPQQTPSEKELEAYRRAELAERNAVQRANRIGAQVNELCESMRGRYEEAGEEIAALAADLTTGLSRLQESFAEVQVIFDDTENAFDELELPESEN